MSYAKKSPEQWNREALEKEAAMLIEYQTSFAPVLANQSGMVALLCHEIRQLRQEVKWCSTYLKRMANAPTGSDEKVPF